MYASSCPRFHPIVFHFLLPAVIYGVGSARTPSPVDGHLTQISDAFLLQSFLFLPSFFPAAGTAQCMDQRQSRDYVRSGHLPTPGGGRYRHSG
ncbi:hypothetical protein B0I35DRAFT_417664 [Stachybotrys elegans]|uniref:Uncharacterized protein n=1 Tax=Stachybotrys elegans TaxID=80388 RepID=A0A8K0T478_9HYPO|nr:hypothetical protein B0I35DRAFT_417664 [Stachybotrys elegans]